MNLNKRGYLKVFKTIFSVFFLLFWLLERLIPRNKNIMVFGAWYGTKYSDNVKALYEYILHNKPELKPYWITHNKKVFQKLKKENKPVSMAYSLKGWLISLRAFAVFINNDTNDINKFALNGAIQIWLWHGMPLKKIRGSNKDYFDNKRDIISKTEQVVVKYIKLFNNFKGSVSATVSSGDFFVPFLQSAFYLQEKDVWLTGLPRTDFFFAGKTEKIIDDLRKKYIDSRIVLFMPTWRDTSSVKRKPYNPFTDSSYDEAEFNRFLEKENVIFMYKPHFRDQDIRISSSGRFVSIKDDDYDELYNLVSNIDILITDYSSIYFDFLCLQKPAILAPFDYEAYISDSREHYFDYNILPSIKAYSWDELMRIIAEKKYYALPKETVEQYCKYNDGHASERALQKTIELLA